MSAPPRPSRLAGAWQRVTDRWNHTPGYLKWLGGLLLGALVRLAFARLFPERWEKVSHRLLDPTMPIWLALALVAAILLVERLVPPLYRRLRSARAAQMRMSALFGVRWAVPPSVAHVQGPYCTVCTTRLRGLLWAGEASPTLWACPSCGREFSTPEFPDITAEAARRLRGARRPSA